MDARRRFLRWYFPIATALVVGTAASAVYVLGAVGTPDTANVWVSPNGSDTGTACVWNSSPVGPPADTSQWCATMNKANLLRAAQGPTGGTAVMGCAASPCTWAGAQIITGTNPGNPGCHVQHVSDLPPIDIFTSTGCLTFRPQLHHAVAVPSITCQCDYVRFQDLNASDSQLTVNGSINTQDPSCAGMGAHTDIWWQNVSADQDGIFGGVRNVYQSGLDIGGRRDDASQWFSCANGANVYIPDTLQVEDSKFHDYYLTHHQGCANGGGFTYTAPTITAANDPSGVLVGGTTYGYTVRMMERAAGNTLDSCMFPQANFALPAGATACSGAPCNAVNITWTNPNPSDTWCAGWEVYGRSTTQSAERRLLVREPATFADPARCTDPADFTLLDNGTLPNLNGAGPTSSADVHMECLHLQAVKTLLFRRNKFWGCAEYNVSLSNASSGCSCDFIGPIDFQHNAFGAPVGELGVPNGPGVIQTVQWDTVGQYFAGTFTNASAVVTALAPNTSTVPVGAVVVTQDTCVTIPANTTIVSVDSATQFTLSAPVAVASGGSPAGCTTNPRVGVSFMTSSGKMLNRFNTYDGPTPWLGVTNGYGYPATAHFYGNLTGFPYTSAFFCNADKNLPGMTLEYDVTVGGIACGTGSVALASQPTVNVSNGTSATNLHLNGCASGAQNLVSTAIADGYSGTDADGNPVPNGGGTGTLLDAGAYEACP